MRITVCLCNKKSSERMAKLIGLLEKPGHDISVVESLGLKAGEQVENAHYAVVCMMGSIPEVNLGLEFFRHRVRTLDLRPGYVPVNRKPLALIMDGNGYQTLVKHSDDLPLSSVNLAVCVGWQRDFPHVTGLFEQMREPIIMLERWTADHYQAIVTKMEKALQPQPSF